MNASADPPAPDGTSPATDEPEGPPPPRPPRAPWLTMALNLALIATIFLTRERWGAWIVEREVPPEGDDPDMYSIMPVCGGTRIVTSSSLNSVRLLDLETGQELAEVRACFWWEVSTDRRRVLAAIPKGFHQTVLILDCGSGEERRIDAGAEIISALAVSPDAARCVVAAGDKGVGVWDVGSGRRLLALQEPGERVTAAEFSPDGAVIATGGGDGIVHLWDARTGRERAVLRGHKLHVDALVFAGDGRRLVSYDGGDCRVWDVEKGSVVVVGDHIYALSPGAGLLATAGFKGDIKLSDIQAGQTAAVLKVHDYWLNMLRFSPDGGRLAARFAHGETRIWDVAAAGLLSCPPTASVCPDARTHLAFMPDGRRIMTWGDDELPRVWKAESGNLLAVLPGQSPCRVLDDRRVCVIDGVGGLSIYRRIRPERWWGVLCLWHLWVIVVLALALAASAWRDIKTMRGRHVLAP